MHWRLPDHEVQVQKGATTDKAFYHGLQVCAMPWTCPVCASKISERRRHEVAKAIKQAEALGLQVFLLTLTVPHGLGDDVNEILDKMMSAWKRLWQGKPECSFATRLACSVISAHWKSRTGQTASILTFTRSCSSIRNRPRQRVGECFTPVGRRLRFSRAFPVRQMSTGAAWMVVARRLTTFQKVSGVWSRSH